MALLVLCLSLVIIGMDNTILNVAIPTLARDMQATGSELQWIVDAYVLVFAGLPLTMGALGDRFGRKRALHAGLVVFALGSVAAAAAGSPEVLIASRVVMGVGGALIMPATLSIITKIGTKIVVATGLAVVAAALWLLSTVDATSGYALVGWTLALLGVGMGFTMAPATESIMGSLPLAKAGVGSAMNDTTLLRAARLAFIDGMSDAVLVGAAVAAFATLLVLVFLPSRPTSPPPASPDRDVRHLTAS